ncbi:hypothetical protein ATI61_1163 [Archangium gephyra]|uniref:STAS domain-containing protein n=2 Tax=Archangium gephyra TaxID=48 RepID=A0ABX9JP35_9BACT|nr:STAS/SEC14 domain-containing protein [Archangium gephyra]REG23535.1 hypothetical protein ATI61_1163 [Archangium gephyra]
MTTQRDWMLGTHHARFDPPDTLRMTIKGDIGLEDARKLTDICREVAEKQPIYLVVDVTGLGGISPELRSFASKNMHASWYRGVVYVGASLVTKAALKSVAMVLYLTGKSPFDIDFVDTPDQVSAAIQRQRLKRGTQAST